MTVDPIKILLIEDNAGDIELVKTGFEEARIANEIQTISDGELALEFVQRANDLPDIVLLDINLPKVDGFEILKAIREGARTSHIPVVMLTSSEADEDIAQSYQYHANSYVSKPVEFDKFLEAIHALEQFWLSVVKLPSC